MKHLLNFQNIEKQEIEKLIDTTLKIETNNSEKINSYALMKFDEGSTRTRLSFSLAAKKSGIEIVEITDLISAKSKGEDLQHEIETYKALGIEILVIRTKENNFQDYENINDLSVISAGFGNSSHPTQAIIDVATLEKFKKFNRDIPVTYVGDLKHSRVFASGRELLGKLGFKVGVYASDELLPDDLSNLQIYNSWDEVVSETGAVELLRVQKERIEDIQEFNFEISKKINRNLKIISTYINVVNNDKILKSQPILANKNHEIIKASIIIVESLIKLPEFKSMRNSMKIL